MLFCPAETPVEIIRPPQNVFEPPGSDVVFEVELNKDRVEVKWLRNNMTVVQGDKYQMMSEGKVHRLQVCEIRPRDQGEYRVIAKDKDAKARLELAGESADTKNTMTVTAVTATAVQVQGIVQWAMGYLEKSVLCSVVIVPATCATDDIPHLLQLCLR